MNGGLAAVMESLLLAEGGSLALSGDSPLPLHSSLHEYSTEECGRGACVAVIPARTDPPISQLEQSNTNRYADLFFLVGLSSALKNSEGCTPRASMIFIMFTMARLRSPRSTPPM